MRFGVPPVYRYVGAVALLPLLVFMFWKMSASDQVGWAVKLPAALIVILPGVGLLLRTEYLELDFAGGRWKRSEGFVPFLRRRSGGFDQLECVRLVREGRPVSRGWGDAPGQYRVTAVYLVWREPGSAPFRLGEAPDRLLHPGVIHLDPLDDATAGTGMPLGRLYACLAASRFARRLHLPIVDETGLLPVSVPVGELHPLVRRAMEARQESPAS